jgi:D-aspartate ligase
MVGPQPVTAEASGEPGGAADVDSAQDRPAVVLGLLWGGLALARALGRVGVPVTGVALDRNDFGIRSRFLRERVIARASDARERDDAVLRALRRTAGNEDVVLFPERDEHVELVLRRWDDVHEVARVSLGPDREAIQRLRRKDLLPASAQEAGIPVPATVPLESEETVRRTELRPPFLLKPEEGQQFAATFGRKVMVARDVDEALAAWRLAQAHGFGTVLQELVPGARDKIFSLFTYIGTSGKPLADVVGRKVRQGPVDFGTSAVFEVRYEARVRELGHRLLRSVAYRGFAQVEFAYDARDDEFKVLEVNTRLPVWAGLVMSRYFDVAKLAYDDLCGRRPQARGTFTDDGVAWIYLAKDLWSSLELARRGELGAREFLRAYLRSKKVRAIFAADDPLPAVASLSYLRSKVA